MSATERFERKIEHSLSEIAQTLRSCVNRARSVLEFAEAGDHDGEWIARARSMKMTLEGALRSVKMQGESKSTLKIERALDDAGKERIVVRCVDSLVDTASQAPVQPSRVEGAPSDSTKEFSGNTAAMSVPMLLQFLSSMSKDGMLQIRSLVENFTLVLHGGTVVYAVSDSTPPGTRLGDVLVAQGAITKGALIAFLQNYKRSGRPLGESLVAREFVSVDQLRKALETQVRSLFQRLFDTEEAMFTFYDGVTNPAQFGVNMNIASLLLESATSLDERRREQAEEETKAAAADGDAGDGDSDDGDAKAKDAEVEATRASDDDAA